jgi:oligosaccharide repeat unit polymerase
MVFCPGTRALMINYFLKTALALLCAGAYYWHYLDFWGVMPLLLVVSAFDFERPLMMKNYFIVFMYLVFIVGGSYFYPGEEELVIDMLLYCTAFLSGYFMYTLLPKKQTGYAGIGISEDRINSLERLILFLCTVKVLLLLNDIRIYGLQEYYSGRALLELFEIYGKQDVTAGVLTIVHNFINIAGIATLVLYVQCCLVLGRRLKYFMIIFYLLVLPLLYLQRGAFALNSMMVLLIYSMDKGNGMHLYRVLITGVGAIVLIGTLFGVLRHSKLTDNTDAETINTEQAAPMIMGELSTVMAYYEIKTNMDILQYQYGSRIILPLLYKSIPRNFMPEKPITSGEYFGNILHSEEAEAGYYLDITFLGDLYLNFGYPGALIGCFLIGLLSSGFDARYLAETLKFAPVYMIIYNFFYVLLRSTLPNSLIPMLLTIAMYWLLSRYFAGAFAYSVAGHSGRSRMGLQ